MDRELLKSIIMIGMICFYLGSFIILSAILAFKFPDEEEENETKV